MRSRFRGVTGAVSAAVVRTPELTIGALAVVATAAFSWVPSIWYDEAATVTSATRSWPQLWAELHKHFTEPELVELGYFIGLTMGQQKFLKTLNLKHGDLGAGTLAGLAPEVAESLRE